ncbi:5-formyltetrahydrofolate cyclo-ligase [Butyrivibrio sp. INlla16]|uniref:5-formyltetrahydrofolate cyclo-ligase n=1 Tax=Butyrivibrio sp. INlla16 TaxID=1520807 RepID=UPI002FE6892A
MRVAEQIAIHYRSPKAELRKQMSDKRNLLSEKEKAELDSSIFRKLIDSKEYTDADNILVYCSMGSEADTHSIICRALSDNKNVFCPVITDNKGRAMEFVRIEALSDLIPGKFGINEPQINNDSVLYKGHEGKTLIILPGLLFDRKGNRIGYGGGFYDKYIMRFKNVISDDTMKPIAIGYNFQLVSDDLTEYMGSFDFKTSMVITDKEKISI